MPTRSVPRPASGCSRPRWRARVPLGVLHDTIQLFPSFSEIYATALRALEGAVAATGQPVSRGLSGCERDALDLLAPRDNDV